MKDRTQQLISLSAMLSAFLTAAALTLERESALAQAGAPAVDDQVVAARENYLLLDERLIDKVENARLSVGTVKKHPANPLFGQEKPWETEISHMYPNVLYDQQERVYKIWYYTHIKGWSKDITPGPLSNREPSRGNCATLYAVSRDGIRWEKPALEVYLHKGNPTNIVVFGDHGTGVFKDLNDPDPGRRYKLITGQAPHGKMYVAFSPDGIRWSERTFVADARGDTHNNALWAPTLNRYVGITREYTDQIRTVLRMESEDFLHWTMPVEVLRGPREAQTYSMPVFAYAGVYLGLPAIFETGTTGRVHTELTWSPDTVRWHRVDEGRQLIPLSEDRGSFEWGCIYAAATPVILEDEIRVYYSGQPGKHGWNPGYLCLATLRADGWASYEPGDKAQSAFVRTAPVACSGETLRLTADAPGGSVTVAVLDVDGKALARSKPVTGTVTSALVEWRDGFKPSDLIGKPARLQFEIARAKLYSFAFRN